jgi:hypothetical protein
VIVCGLRATKSTSPLRLLGLTKLTELLDCFHLLVEVDGALMGRKHTFTHAISREADIGSGQYGHLKDRKVFLTGYSSGSRVTVLPHPRMDLARPLTKCRAIFFQADGSAAWSIPFDHFHSQEEVCDQPRFKLHSRIEAQVDRLLESSCPQTWGFVLFLVVHGWWPLLWVAVLINDQ